MNKKKYLVFILLLTLVFILFIFFFENYVFKKKQIEINNIAQIISSSLWNFDQEAPFKYLTIHCKKGNYKKLHVTDKSGELFIKLENELTTPFDKFFIIIKLIRINSIYSDIIYKNKKIGILSASVYNMSIFVYLYLFAILFFATMTNGFYTA
ncbi:hypothetical protein KAH94_06455 [bacterium]|nr:hypothetical protein [bacterium]